VGFDLGAEKEWNKMGRTNPCDEFPPSQDHPMADRPHGTMRDLLAIALTAAAAARRSTDLRYRRHKTAFDPIERLCGS
jgi:hypothetical protein